MSLLMTISSKIEQFDNRCATVSLSELGSFGLDFWLFLETVFSQAEIWVPLL